MKPQIKPNHEIKNSNSSLLICVFNHAKDNKRFKDYKVHAQKSSFGINNEFTRLNSSILSAPISVFALLSIIESFGVLLIIPTILINWV